MRTNIKPVPNWRRLLRHAWSVRFLAIAAILSGLEAVLPLVGDLLPISQRAYALLTFIIVIAALIARFVIQKNISGDEL